MKKTWTIARHEFTTTIRRISYILLTISFPLLGLLGILIFLGVSQWGGEGPPLEEIRIGYVDETSMFDEYTNPDGIVFILYDTNDEARDALFSEDVSEYFIIPEDYLETGLIERYTTERELGLPQVTMALMEDFLVANLLAGEVSDEVLERAQTPLLPISTRLDPETGEIIPPESEIAAFAMPYAFALLFMMSLFFTSGYLLQGVSEEKENRLIEILLSSVSARQLLSGKVIGLGAAGLIQIVIWFISSVALLAIASLFISLPEGLTIPIGLIIFGIIYFILGYLLFGILMTTLGSIGSTAGESSQWTMLIVMPAVAPLILISLFINNPDHVIFTVFTLFPLTAPVAAIMKLSIGAFPVWELLLSITILTASIVGAMWLAARVFRTFLLMYGKRPSFREIRRYIREG
ncbi:MAG: ABC transporter permease subunit [Dehalococcoidia bacterium]|nr:ABC transporter permease subunit [Dehalococcoidia bacterium]